MPVSSKLSTKDEVIILVRWILLVLVHIKSWVLQIAWNTENNIASSFVAQAISGATTTNDTVTEIDPTNSYCFRFTWMGPEYDNATNYNGTCDDYLNQTNAVAVPCRQPIVVTCKNRILASTYLLRCSNIY